LNIEFKEDDFGHEKEKQEISRVFLAVHHLRVTVEEIEAHLLQG